jgi:hypothetical protein
LSPDEATAVCWSTGTGAIETVKLDPVRQHYMTTTRKLQQYRDFAGGEDDADDEGE